MYETPPSECQTSGWSSHKAACKESADAPHYLVKVQKEQAQYAMKMNVNDCAIDTLHGRAVMPSRQRAKIAVPDKYGKKRFVVKLQSPLDIGPAASSAPIMLNDPTREMEGRECRLPLSGSGRKLTADMLWTMMLQLRDLQERLLGLCADHQAHAGEGEGPAAALHVCPARRRRDAQAVPSEPSEPAAPLVTAAIPPPHIGSRSQ